MNLPYKWLASESIRDNIFSVYSDIWSYGMKVFHGIVSSQKLFIRRSFTLGNIFSRTIAVPGNGTKPRTF